MKLFDFNIHLPSVKHEDVNVVIHNDLNLDLDGVKKGIILHSEIIDKPDNINVLLFNTTLFENRVIPVQSLGAKNAVYTALVDFRKYDLIPYLENLKASGVKAIMFNSYLQQISEPDFLLVLKACKFAEENKLLICIDGSFGTSKMYAYDNLNLSCFVADLIEKTKIIIVHSGGRRIIDFMLLALEKRNVWLDTSFSLPFYLGSSLEQDYAFAYKKIGVERIVYGSDYPYVDIENAFEQHQLFFQKYHFKDSEVENIFHRNSEKLFDLS